MKAIIFGGGKIARGFIAHLLHSNGTPFVFVDVNDRLISEINYRTKYHVHIMGRAEPDYVIDGIRALSISDISGIANELVDTDIAFTAVGGKNLTSIGKVLAHAFELRCSIAHPTRPMNIVTCENWKDPAKVLAEEVKSHLGDETKDIFRRWIGVTEAVVMRSAVEPPQEMVNKDPLCVCVQDFWELPIDSSRMKGTLPSIQGFRYINEFSGFLERKFFTYNAANGTVSYLGYLRKHQLISEAASDHRIIPVLDGVYAETGKALCAKYNLNEEEQRAFALSSKRKLQDANIIDYVERNARDPLRKLGPDDRLVGAARLALKYGITPHSIATAIAAALYYDHPLDPSAQELCRMRERDGVDAILQMVCKLTLNDPLMQLVKEKIEVLRNEVLIQQESQ